MLHDEGVGAAPKRMRGRQRFLDGHVKHGTTEPSRLQGVDERGLVNDGAAAEPIPGPLSAEEIERMTRDQAREALLKVSRSRQRSNVSDEVQERLKIEFDLLLERFKKD